MASEVLLQTPMEHYVLGDRWYLYTRYIDRDIQPHIWAFSDKPWSNKPVRIGVCFGGVFRSMFRGIFRGMVRALFRGMFRSTGLLTLWGLLHRGMYLGMYRGMYHGMYRRGQTCCFS